MEEKEIRELFLEEIHKRSAGKNAGLTKDQLYHFRHGYEPTVGLMLEVLWRLDKLDFKV
jgi:hypothetical protein